MAGAVQVLTTPVVYPAQLQADALFIRSYDVVDDVDASAPEFHVDLLVLNGSNRSTAKQLDSFRVILRNGSAVGIRTKAVTATGAFGAGTVFEEFSTTTGVATAFTDAVTASKAANPKNALRVLIAGLGLIPAGS